MIGLRARLDRESHQTVDGYGQALVHVGSLISKTFEVTMPTALSGRGLDAARLDAVYRDLRNSARRCKSFLGQQSSVHDAAQSLVMACLLLQHLYRMRFHALKAEGTLQQEAEETAEQIITLVRTILEMNLEMKRPAAKPLQTAVHHLAA